MYYMMFIDDERMPVDDDWLICRTSGEAIEAVQDIRELPTFISFDHDLGGNDTSMIFIHWLSEFMQNNNISFPKGFGFYVHSQNPIGKSNIEGLMNNMIKEFGID